MNDSIPLITGLASQAGHWYAADGSPAYEILGKNGLLRAVTLRDARVKNLYPSVTTIQSVAAKPGLERWKLEQAILSALTLPRVEGETETDYAARVLADSKEQSSKAAALGTLIHEQIEKSFTDSTDPEWIPYVEPVRKWLDHEFPGVKWNAEKSFVHAAGFGGKVDLHSAEDRIVIDFKTKAFDDPKGVKAWPEHGIQLAAYAHGLGLDAWEDQVPQRWNIFVSSTTPGMIVTSQWESDSYYQHLDMFLCLLKFWQLEKGYAPRPALAA
jgi:hypothetical protein